MEKSRKIKGLQSQLKQLYGDRESLKVDVSNKQKELSLKNKSIKAIERQIETYEKDNDVKVSEHAIVRYFERVLGFDIPVIEKEIKNGIEEQIKVLGSSGNYVVKTYTAVVSDNTVVTIY